MESGIYYISEEIILQLSLRNYYWRLSKVIFRLSQKLFFSFPSRSFSIIKKPQLPSTANPLESELGTFGIF